MHARLVHLRAESVTRRRADLEPVAACDDCVGTATGIDSGSDRVDDGCQPCAAATGSDVDADGVDDACDACTRGPSHDEDGDGVDDACDNCPTQSNADQVPGMGVLGVACNRGVANWQHFDALVEQDITLWPGIVAGWTWVNDGPTVEGETSRTMLVDFGASYAVETRGTAHGSISIQCTTTNSNISCTLDQSTRTLVLTLAFGLSGGGLPLLVTERSGPLPPTGAIRFELRVDAATSTTYCEAFDVAGTVIATAQRLDGTACERLKVRSDVASRLEYLWSVSE